MMMLFCLVNIDYQKLALKANVNIYFSFLSLYSNLLYRYDNKYLDSDIDFLIISDLFAQKEIYYFFVNFHMIEVNFNKLLEGYFDNY